MGLRWAAPRWGRCLGRKRQQGSLRPRHQCHVLGKPPGTRQPPRHSTSLHGHPARQRALPQPCLHCRCAQRGACGAQPPPSAAAGSSKAEASASTGRKTHPSLTCLASLYSTPVFLAHAPCLQAASCKVAGNLIRSQFCGGAPLPIANCGGAPLPVADRKGACRPPQEPSKALTDIGSPQDVRIF